MTLCHPGLHRDKSQQITQRVEHWIITKSYWSSSEAVTGVTLCVWCSYFSPTTVTFDISLRHVAALHPGLFSAAVGVGISISPSFTVIMDFSLYDWCMLMQTDIS